MSRLSTRFGVFLLLAAVPAGHLSGAGVVADPPVVPVKFDAAPAAVSADELDEAEAMAEARASGEPVEATELTTAFDRVVAHPDGRLMAELSPAPVRVKRDGEWLPVDLALEPDASSGRLVPVVSPAEVSVSAGGEDSLVTVADGDRRLSLDWPDALPEPVLDGPRATYPDVLPDVDLVVESQLTGFATFLLVNSAEAAANPALRQVDFGLDVKGATVSQNAEGLLEARDGDGGVVFSTDPARMWDASPARGLPMPGTAVPPTEERPGARSAPLGVSVTQSGGREVLRLVPDLELLRDPEARFPVVIDPAWKVNKQEEKAWGMVWSNGYKFFNTSHKPRVGYDGWSSATKKSRTFYKFGMKRFHGKRINKATLRHHQIHSPGWSCDTTDGPAVKVYRTAVFGSGISWPGPDLWGMQDKVNKAHGHQDACPGYDINEWDVTTGVKNAAGNLESRVALGMVSANEGDRMGWRKYKDTDSIMPRLLVWYNTRPNKPTNLDLWTTGTQKANWFGSLNRWYTNKDRPYLAGKVTDPDGDLLKFRYQVWKDSTKLWDFTTSNEFDSGRYLKRRVGSDAITTERGYRFRIRGIDEQGWGGPWSDWVYFTYDGTAPAPPTIVPPDQQISYGQGGYHKLEPGSGGAAWFHYGFTTSATPNMTAKSANDASRRVFYKPSRFGPDWITARAQDRAGNMSAASTFDFRVKGAEATHSWHLDDRYATTGGMDLSLAGSPSWGEGVHRWYNPFGGDAVDWNTADGGLLLNGSDQYADTSGPVLADTSKSFSVSAWVRLDPAEAAGKYNMVVSQHGSDSSAFYLEYRKDSWSFRVRSQEGGGTPAAATMPASLGSSAEWVHLVGVYERPQDVKKGVVKLYVNGTLAETTDAPAGVFKATKALRIGASHLHGSPNNFLAGTVDDVRVFPGAVDPVGALALSTEIRDR